MNQNNLKSYKNDFITSFYEIDLDFNNQNIIKYIENYSFEKRDIKTTYFDNNQILEQEKLKELKELIYNVLQAFCTQVLKKSSFAIKESWLQIYNKNDTHPIHIHGPYEQNYSLIFYINTTSSSGKTTFYAPGFPYVPEKKITITPKNSKLIIFPGHIPHCAESNNDEQRAVLSANLDFYDTV